MLIYRDNKEFVCWDYYKVWRRIEKKVLFACCLIHIVSYLYIKRK